MITKKIVSLTNEEKTFLLKASDFFDKIAEQFSDIEWNISDAAEGIASDISIIIETLENDFNINFN